jgi:hypothetical protein
MSTTSGQPPRDSAREGALPPPDYNYGIRRRPRNGWGVASLVVGVVALVLALLVLFFPLAGLFGLVAVVLGLFGLRLYSQGEADNQGNAIAGIATGSLAIVLAIVIGVRVGQFFAQHQNDFRRLGTCLTSADTDRDRAKCARDLSRRFRD